MKTDEFIALLAEASPAADRRAPARRYAIAMLLGLAGATVLTALGLGVRSDLLGAMHLPVFWARLGYAGTIGGASLWLVARLARPGAAIGSRWIALAAPVVAAWTGMALVLASAGADARLPLLLGHSWKVCPLLIALLSVPTFAAMTWAVRGMAPVRPRLAGAAIGLLAGATATVAYCFHCPELEMPFWVNWYLLGMSIPAAVGALIGPRVLGW